MKLLGTVVLLLGLGSPLFAMGSFDDSPVEIKAGPLPASAQVTEALPTLAKKGSLVFFQGNGFGSQARPLFWGETPVNQVLYWSETLVALRLPADPAAEVSWGWSSGEGPKEQQKIMPLPGLEKAVFQPALKTYTVRWVIPLEKTRAATKREWKNLPPLEIVLEKTLEHFPLIPDRTGNFLYTEAELPWPDTKPLLQAQRFVVRPVTGESKDADLLTQLWAKNDPFPVINDEPAFYPGDQDTRWDPKLNRLNLVSP